MNNACLFLCQRKLCAFSCVIIQFLLIWYYVLNKQYVIYMMVLLQKLYQILNKASFTFFVWCKVLKIISWDRILTRACQQIGKTNRQHISYLLAITVIPCIHMGTLMGLIMGRRGSSRVSTNLVICVSLYVNIFMGVNASNRYMIEMHRMHLLHLQPR